MKKLNRKIPGILPPPPKTELDGKITDLFSKTVPELLELRERQEKLLKNVSFISKLPDKGAKIKLFCDKIVETLKTKQDENQTCRMLDNLTLNSVDKQTIQDVEWEGKVKPERDLLLDSDDDSEPEDVMHILTQHTAKERIVEVSRPIKPLITPEDLRNIGEIPHVKYIVKKTENQANPKKNTGQFKPYNTTKTNVHDPRKEKVRKKGKHWEVTAATPPLTVHGPAKMLNLEESLKLQQEYNRHLKNVEAKHAAEKLLAHAGIKMAELPDDLTKFGTYREMDSGTETDNEGSDKEVLDEEPDRGGVVFTVMN